MKLNVTTMLTPNLGSSAIQVPQGNIKLAAEQFLHWAHSQSLLSPDAFHPSGLMLPPNFGPDGVDPAAIVALRHRQIRFVGVNDADRHIHVHLKRAAPTVREMKSMPSVCNGFSLKYHQGNPQPVSPSAVAESATSWAVHRSNGETFYTCGSSISVGNARVAGTLGCLLRDQAGNLFGLSNNHVSASCNYAPAGLPIVAPGVLDVGPGNPYPFTLGTHTRQLPMRMGDPSNVDVAENSDAAVFSIVAPNAISSMQRGYYDTPDSCVPLAPGMAVDKVGRSSDRTMGVVRAEVVGPIPVTYSAPQYDFSGQVYFEPMFIVHGVGDRFSESGDSGSLVTHLDPSGRRHAVGLIVAGFDDSSAPGGKCSLIVALEPILQRLQLTLASNHNC